MDFLAKYFVHVSHAHFIDKDWKLHKRILNFCVVHSHKGKEIGKAIELCLLDWRIEKLCTLTIDNASSNGVAVKYLKNKFSKKNGCIIDRKYFHVRCCANILNLIVKDGIKMKLVIPYLEYVVQ